MESSTAAAPRHAALDAARGGLLVAMLLVHVVSGEGRADQINAMHAWLGVFLISGGFVWLSGFVRSLRERESGVADLLRALRLSAQLLLAMVAYGVLLSLLRHLLLRAAGGDQACAARAGWAPPLRFDDLGILLPIALVQLASPLARVRRAPGALLLVAAAIGSLLLPAALANAPHSGPAGAIAGVLVRRTLTPFYTVTTFFALGLVGVALARAPLRRWLLDEPRLLPGLAGLLLSLAMGVPVWSSRLLDAVFRFSSVLGAAATLAWWTAAMVLFLRGLSTLGKPAPVRAALCLLGRHSLFVFVLHDFLLELDAFARLATGAQKGLWLAAALSAADLVVLLGAAWAIDRFAALREAARAFLLEPGPSRSRLGAAGLNVAAGLALAGVLAVYTSTALARPTADVLIDDFESHDGCPKWWSFGPLRFGRAPAEGKEHGAQVLDVAGKLPPGVSSGAGLYVAPDIGGRRTLLLDVRGYGPDSGRLRIELFEDDNGNWEIEKDPHTYDPLFDDRWAVELPVDWMGWRQLALPASAFHDDNPGIGNGVFDPERDGTSGGLLEMQLLVLPSSGRGGEVHVQLDNVRWAP